MRWDRLILRAAGAAAALTLAAAGTTMVAAQDKRGVDLPEGDPLLRAIQARLGRPDRVTGSGRTLLHYDLKTGDTLTLVVSGNKVVGVTHAAAK